MSDLRKAAEQALEALEIFHAAGQWTSYSRAALTALRAALDAQEPTRKAATEDTTHTCHAECDRPICVAVREAVKAEREACAEYAAALAEAGWSAGSIQDALRARGET